MAVRIDIDALRSEAGPAASSLADELIAFGRLGEITPAGGGVVCLVRQERTPPCEVWVGVTVQGFTAECDCPAEEDLCAHAVALAVAALEDGFAWSSAATPPSAQELDPKVRELAEIAGTLSARRLALLLAEQAATDRALELRLLTYAGRVEPPTDAELTAVCQTIDRLAADATSGHRWGLDDVAKAGRWIVEEAEEVAQRPVNEGSVLLAEHAARAWDRLAGPLHGAWEEHDTAPEEIGDALRSLHVQLCEQLQPDPDELTARLRQIIVAAEVESCLGNPDDYLAVLGPERVKTLLTLTG